MNRKGTYCLFFKIGDINIKTRGKEFSLKSGMYVYVGSAFGSGGLKARIERHLRREKKLHWHIDYVSTDVSFEMLSILILRNRKLECQMAEVLNKMLKPIKGFGCTDCKCESHLFNIEEKRLKGILNFLEETYGFENYTKQLDREKKPIL